MTTLIFSKPEWKTLRQRIENEHGDKIFLITWRLKRELGFTVRTHFCYDEYNQRATDIRLDFDDPARATFFQIKYL